MESILLVTLSGLAVSAYLPYPRISQFTILSVQALLVWRFVFRHEPVRTVPNMVILFSVLFFLSLLLSALASHYQGYAFYQFNEYKYFFLGGLLYAAPVNDRYRKIIIAIFFIAAAVEGLVGILQYFRVLELIREAPNGFTLLSIIYATKLALVCGAAVFLLFYRGNGLFQSKKGFLFLLITAFLTFGGIVFAMSRGVWIAFLASCASVLFIYDRKKALFAFLIIMLFIGGILSFNKPLRARAISIITSVYTENEQGSTGNRIELWKGSLLLFKESPLLGIGVGDYQTNIKRLIQEGKLKAMPTTLHAHSIFFQTLATQGVIGFTILIGLFIALLRWGMKEIEDHGRPGGYIIIMSTLLIAIEGLFDNNLCFPKFIAACFFTIGLIGPYGTKNTELRSVSGSG